MANSNQHSLLVDHAFAVYKSGLEKNKNQEVDLTKFRDVLIERKDAIDWLSDYSYLFSGWIKAIIGLFLTDIDNKRKSDSCCESEVEMLSDLPFFLSKMAYNKELFAAWSAELDTIIQKLETNVE